MNDWSHPEIQALVQLALQEDIGSGDVTSATCVPADRTAVGSFYARADVILAGIELLPMIYQLRGGLDELRLERHSGAQAVAGDRVAFVRGRARTLLECERVCLNFLQRLSGIATLAGKYAQAVSGSHCRVLDTRKTTPGLRRLEKLAAAAGGVTNHRLGLYDAILIKNNHISAAGGVRAALHKAQDCNLPIEIEVRTQAELEEALACGATNVLLDNLTPEQAAERILFIAGRAKVELSGNINLSTVRAYAETGADFVSCGAITHSAVAADFNFRIELA
ncbi:MAG TPA: carboxylating nicotinate-nucleotide diphosphorylase [Bryobacteraceae bacterium]|nr:carboxylating nicotinate-nucleotide diphosphorylase [Bryobacteraceae bacterium]